MTSDLGLWTLLLEYARLLQPRRYLEIGVREGDSLRHVLAGWPVPELVLCDTWGGQHGGTGRGSHAHIEVLLASLGWHGDVQWLDGRSQDLLPTLSTAADLVLVDGSHEQDEALTDLRLAWPLTRRVLLVDDTTFSGVASALATFIAEAGVTPQWFTGGHGVAVFTRVDGACGVASCPR